MKEFKNQITEVNVPDFKRMKGTKDVFMKLGSYADLSLICVRQPTREGFTIDEMKQRFRIIDVLENIKDDARVLLEDQDAVLLQNIVASHKWEHLHKDISAFGDYIADLKTVKK